MNIEAEARVESMYTQQVPSRASPKGSPSIEHPWSWGSLVPLGIRSCQCQFMS